jgi:hypothetical protein
MLLCSPIPECESACRSGMEHIYIAIVIATVFRQSRRFPPRRTVNQLISCIAAAAVLPDFTLRMQRRRAARDAAESSGAPAAAAHLGTTSYIYRCSRSLCATAYRLVRSAIHRAAAASARSSFDRRLVCAHGTHRTARAPHIQVDVQVDLDEAARTFRWPATFRIAARRGTARSFVRNSVHERERRRRRRWRRAARVAGFRIHSSAEQQPTRLLFSVQERRL